MFYPTFEFIENRGWFPNITLPKDFEKLVPHFYEKGRKTTIEEYAKLVEDRFGRHLEIRLRWNDKKGLTNINIGPSGGLDLTDNLGYPHFAEHNLGTNTSITSGMIAMKYISELLKSK